MSAPRAAAAVLLALFALALAGCDGYGDDDTTTSTRQAASTENAQETATAVAADGSGSLSQQEEDGIAGTLTLVDAGGPFPHEQDGQTFQNREGHLPDQPEGYYREYTVETPGSDDRGARRLVIGEGGETYYTNDHYDSFIRIEPEDFK